MRLLVTDDPDALKQMEGYFEGKVDAFLVDGAGFFKFKPSVVQVADCPHTDAPYEIVKSMNVGSMPLFYDSFGGGWVTLEERGWGGDDLVSFSYGVQDRQQLYDECIIYCKNNAVMIGSCYQIIDLFDMTLGVPKIYFADSDLGLDSLTPWDGCVSLIEAKKRRDSLSLVRYWWESNFASILADILDGETSLPDFEVEDGLVVEALTALGGRSNVIAFESAFAEMVARNNLNLDTTSYPTVGVAPFLDKLIKQGVLELSSKDEVCFTKVGELCSCLCEGVFLMQEYGRLFSMDQAEVAIPTKTLIRELFGGYLQSTRFG